ncbi:hypothetical protein [Brevundimonas sp.]|uniref:hypothetical protein n=1 Tax=Brevundimonas sp. TaxID=1871086 RepID=UPI002B53B4E8|nr:hypothetical protein [Brevundimonas sp.]HWQ87530.1 hypothetical protein [Brevundimonas sp.]
MSYRGLIAAAALMVCSACEDRTDQATGRIAATPTAAAPGTGNKGDARCVDPFIEQAMGLALLRQTSEPMPGLMGFPLEEGELVSETFGDDIVRRCRATAALLTVKGRASAPVTYELVWSGDRPMQVRIVEARRFRQTFTDLYRSGG